MVLSHLSEVKGLFLGFHSESNWLYNLFLYSLDYYSFVINFKIKKCESSGLSLLSRVNIVYLESLRCHMNFRMQSLFLYFILFFYLISLSTSITIFSLCFVLQNL